MSISTLLTNYLADTSTEGRKKLAQLRAAITEVLNDEQDFAPDDPEWGPVRLIMRDDTVGGGLHGNLNKGIIDLSKRMAYIKQQNEILSDQVNSGFILVSSFEDGATLTLSNEVLLWEQDGQYYRWTGGLPKTVDVSSTPDTAGGIGGGKWVLVGDGAFRSELKLYDGLKFIGQCPDIDTLRTIEPIVDKQRIYVTGYYFGSSSGGGCFYYDKNDVTSIDDKGLCIVTKLGKRWKRVIEKNIYTPAMFGVIGDGIEDDYLTFQSLLDAVPAHAVIELDGSKTYFNNFSNNVGMAGNWLINKSLVLNCNHALLTRKTAIESVDEQTAILRIEGDSRITINDAVINGNNPTGKPIQADGTMFANTDIALCKAINYGILLHGASNVTINNVHISNCLFNIWAHNGKNLKLSGVLQYSGQKTVGIVNDLQFGAGIKLSNYKHFNIDVVGFNNANATVEIESNNEFGYINVVSKNNLSNGVVILDSAYITGNVTTDKTNAGSGLLIRNTSQYRNTENINLNVISSSCKDRGITVQQEQNVSDSAKLIFLNAQVSRSGNVGMEFVNKSSDHPIDVVNIKYNGIDNVSTTYGNDIWINGDIRGHILGSSKGCYCGCIINGTTSQYGIHIEMDFQEVSKIAFWQTSEVIVDLSGSKSSSTYWLASNVNNLFIAKTATSSGAGGNYTNYNSVLIKAKYTYLPDLTATADFSNQLYIRNADNIKYIVQK